MIYGHGRLVVDSKDLGSVEYKLQVTQPAGDRPGFARGFIYARQDAIDEAAGANHAEIVRDDTGGTMRIVVTSTLGDGRADVTVSGDPGPENS